MGDGWAGWVRLKCGESVEIHQQWTRESDKERKCSLFKSVEMRSQNKPKKKHAQSTEFAKTRERITESRVKRVVARAGADYAGLVCLSVCLSAAENDDEITIGVSVALFFFFFGLPLSIALILIRLSIFSFSDFVILVLIQKIQKVRIKKK